MLPSCVSPHYEPGHTKRTTTLFSINKKSFNIETPPYVYPSRFRIVVRIHIGVQVCAPRHVDVMYIVRIHIGVHVCAPRHVDVMYIVRIHIGVQVCAPRHVDVMYIVRIHIGVQVHVCAPRHVDVMYIFYIDGMVCEYLRMFEILKNALSLTIWVLTFCISQISTVSLCCGFTG